MFELVDEIPVTFNPNWTDEWMVWLTLGSIAVTGLLGWLAFWNGRKAGIIAHEASEREQRYRDSLTEARKADDRTATSMAVMRAITAHDRLRNGKEHGATTDQQQAETRTFNTLHLEALASTALYRHDEEAMVVHEWYMELHTALLKSKSLDDFRAVRGSAIDTVQAWTWGLLPAQDFPKPSAQVDAHG